MAAPPPPAIELSESDVLPIDDEWGPADSIPLVELSAVMEVEREPAPVVAVKTIEPAALPTPVADVPRPQVASVSALSTTALGSTRGPSESLVTWAPRRRSFGWIMGSAAAASVAVILLGWSLTPTQANAEPAAAAQEVVIIRAEVPQVEPQRVVVEPEQPSDDRATARKLATIGNRQLKDGNLATAQTFFERALEAQANNRMAHAGLGKIALRRKQPRRALEHLRMAVEIEPRKADNRRLLGQAYLALGRKDKAKDHLKRAVAYGDVPAQQLLMDL